MIYCKEPITIETLVKDILTPQRDFDYVSYRMFLGKIEQFTKTSETIFAGCFAISCIGGLHIASLDGDTYSLLENVLAYEEWTDPDNNVYNGLTIIVASEDN